MLSRPTSGFKLGPNSREKSRNFRKKWQSDREKLQHKITAFSLFRSKLAITHTITIKWKEKYDPVVVDCHNSLCSCGDKMKMSLPKIIFFFREASTSPWIPFGAKFRPLGQLSRSSCPLAYSLHLINSFLASSNFCHLRIIFAMIFSGMMREGSKGYRLDRKWKKTGNQISVLTAIDGLSV